MAGREDTLAPPARNNTQDPGAHELESESDDHFSDAQSAPSQSDRVSSELPKTRVEKVDNEPSFGEVPGTEAYQKRASDAEPDEIAIVPDSSSIADVQGDGKQDTPLETPVPLTVVEETVDSAGSITHSGTRHKSDAVPDKVVRVDYGKADEVDTPIVTSNPSPPAEAEVALRSPSQVIVGTSLDESGGAAAVSATAENEENEDKDQDDDDDNDGDFGDDFEDFEEGGDNDDDEFGDFDDGFQEPKASEEVTPPLVTASQPPAYTLSFPVPDFEGLDADAVMATAEPYLNAIYPPDDDDIVVTQSYPKESPIFQTPRSASLWAQLVAPPPLQPPDWIRSRIRRLFLVSLGVPVDLDEILPASKQKKLVLPSLHRTGSNGSLRTSTDSRTIVKLKQEASASTTSLDSQGNKKPRPSGDGAVSSTARKKNEPVEPDLDLVAAKQLCMTTDQALDGMTDRELKEHVAKLEAIEGSAKELLEYWQKRTDEKIGDREAFEGVIENLVKHARKVRK